MPNCSKLPLRLVFDTTASAFQRGSPHFPGPASGLELRDLIVAYYKPKPWPDSAVKAHDVVALTRTWIARGFTALEDVYELVVLTGLILAVTVSLMLLRKRGQVMAPR